MIEVSQTYNDRWAKIRLSELNDLSFTVADNYRHIIDIKTNIRDIVGKNLIFCIPVPLGLVVSYYRLVSDSCNAVNQRLKDHGYGLDDITTLQESLCAIYRHNSFDRHKVFFSYMKQSHDQNLVLNDCMNCLLSVEYKKNCKMYLKELDRR